MIIGFPTLAMDLLTIFYRVPDVKARALQATPFNSSEVLAEFSCNSPYTIALPGVSLNSCILLLNVLPFLLLPRCVAGELNNKLGKGNLATLLKLLRVSQEEVSKWFVWRLYHRQQILCQSQATDQRASRHSEI